MPKFDLDVTWQEETTPASPVLMLTFDSKGVPMRHADLRPATQADATARGPTRARRLKKGEKRHTRRMAQVAAVYKLPACRRTAEDILRELAPRGAPASPRPRREGKRVWASLLHEPAEVIEGALLDASSRDPQRQKPWVVLDGQADQWRRVRAAARRGRVAVTIVVDLIHVLEYLWKAAYVFHPEGSRAAERWVTERVLWLLGGDVVQVIASIRRTATCRGLRAAARRPADTCARYPERHRACLRYDQYLRAGFPIATGVIEGACRHLIRDRLTLTGARWSLAGAEAILQLRALRASGDWDTYWHYHEQQEHARHHTSKYANDVVPTLTVPEPESPRNTRKRQPSHLRVVR